MNGPVPKPRPLTAREWQEFTAFTAYYAEALSAAQALAGILSCQPAASPASDPDHDVLLRIARAIAASAEHDTSNSDRQRRELTALASACVTLHRVGRDLLAGGASEKHDEQCRRGTAWREHGQAARELAIRLIAIKRIVLLSREKH